MAHGLAARNRYWRQDLSCEMANAPLCKRRSAPIAAISLFDPGHVPAAADADRAAFDADRCGAKLKETSRVTVPVVDIVKPPGPAPRAIRHQPIENRDADKRAAALRRVGIVLVGPRPACLRIDGGFRAGDGRAQRGTTRSDLHVRPVLRQPKAPGIGRCGTRAKQRKNRHGGRGAKPGELHDTYFVSPGRTSKPKSLPYRRLARSKARDVRGSALAVWVREQGAWKFVAYQPTPIINR
jgi:hypothetical protein